MPEPSQPKVLACVSLTSWAVALILMLVVQPDSGTVQSRLFFVALGVALCAGTLATLPWMMHGFIRDQVLAYVAGYMHREADDPAEDRPALTVVR